MNQELLYVEAGFRKGRQTRDQIASIRWIIEKAREFQKNIYFCFIDYAKSFDCVDHNKLWKILKEMGIPDHLTCLLRNLYADEEAAVRTGHGTTDWLQTGKGAWRASVHGVARSQTRLNNWTELINVIVNISQFTWAWNSCSLLFLEFRIAWFISAYFSVCVLVAQLCLTFCDPMDCSPPVSSVRGILQARILEWVAIPFSRGSSRPGIELGSSALRADSWPSEPPEKPYFSLGQLNRAHWQINLNNIIQIKDTHWGMHIIWTDRDLIVFHLRFKISLCPFFPLGLKFY